MNVEEFAASRYHGKLCFIMPVPASREQPIEVAFNNGSEPMKYWVTFGKIPYVSFGPYEQRVPRMSATGMVCFGDCSLAAALQDTTGLIAIHCIWPCRPGPSRLLLPDEHDVPHGPKAALDKVHPPQLFVDGARCEARARRPSREEGERERERETEPAFSPGGLPPNG
jgi:hypothetical protein